MASGCGVPHDRKNKLKYTKYKHASIIIIYIASNINDIILPHEENHGITLRCLKQVVLSITQILCFPSRVKGWCPPHELAGYVTKLSQDLHSAQFYLAQLLD